MLGKSPALTYTAYAQLQWLGNFSQTSDPPGGGGIVGLMEASQSVGISPGYFLVCVPVVQVRGSATASEKMLQLILLSLASRLADMTNDASEVWLGILMQLVAFGMHCCMRCTLSKWISLGGAWVGSARQHPNISQPTQVLFIFGTSQWGCQ